MNSPNPATPTPDLLPCPFCGNPATRDDEYFYWVGCVTRDCPIAETDWMDAEAWNRRAPIPPAPSPGLREAAQAVYDWYWDTDADEGLCVIERLRLALILPGEAKAVPPAVRPEDVDIMDYGIGNYTRERGKLWDTWTRIKSTLAQPVAETTPKETE